MSGGSTTGALSTLPAHSHFAAIALAIPISRAWSRPRMTPALRNRRSSSFPLALTHWPRSAVHCRASARRHGPRERYCAPVAERALPVKPAKGTSSRCRSGTAPGGHALRDCLGLLESLVRYGERHIAQDACWLAVTFTHLRAALALAMAASLWPGIGFGTRRCMNNRVPSDRRLDTTP